MRRRQALELAAVGFAAGLVVGVVVGYHRGALDELTAVVVHHANTGGR